MARYADVILPLPLEGTYTYTLPAPIQEKVRVGCRLVVPFGAKKIYAAVVVALRERRPEGDFQLKAAIELLDESPIILSGQLKLWRWIADYYLCSLGEVCKAALPGRMKMEVDSLDELRKTLESGRRRADKWALSTAETASVDRMTEGNDTAHLHPLSETQEGAKNCILQHFEKRDVCLLHGVTSSGKTEVYMHLINDVINGHSAFHSKGDPLPSGDGKGQVLYLLPEIVLTAQLVDRLKRVFGERLGVYHSRYSDAERERLWRKQLSDEPYDIIVGVRSSVFLPFQRLQLVIVDEEHETSFKQQEPAPRYHARNVALVLAQMYGAKSLLGTATPSVETYHNALQGKYGLVTLNERYGNVELPRIEKVDIADMRRRKMMDGPFSPRLLEAMREALGRGEQVILFQNRRGFAPYIECKDCSWVPRCERCDVSLTYHKGSGRMTCHYCGASYPIPAECPNCGCKQLKRVGYGTERIEDDLHRLLPEARVARMDQDTTQSRRAYEGILHDFEQGETDILVGTQMVAKGLDIERVTVVGILNADTMMNFPDFRSHERAFQMMAQVAGRAGRRETKGLVILQTKDKDSSTVANVLNNDYTSMYQEQIEEREAFQYPPFCRLTYVYMKHREARVVERMANELAGYLRSDYGSQVMGPDTPPVGRVQRFHIRKIVLKIGLTTSLSSLRKHLRDLQAYMLSLPKYKSAQLYFDVDPY